MDSYKINKICPECKQQTMFNIDGMKYFCNNCMYEIEIANFNPDITSPETEKIKDIIVDPEILINTNN